MSKNKRTINITNAVQQLYINGQKRAWNDDAAKHGAHENRKKHEACENAQKNTRRVKNHKYESWLLGMADDKAETEIRIGKVLIGRARSIKAVAHRQTWILCQTGIAYYLHQS